MSVELNDRGPDFEPRALAMARAIYDPSGMQGAINVLGQERDALFVSDRAIVAFEFTTRGDKEKARRDAEKLRDLLKHLSGQAEHRLKSTQGFVVTMREPSADQREAVSKVAAVATMQLQIISYVTLQKSLIDSERYIALRLQAPFGSASFGASPQLTGYDRGRDRTDQPKYVEPRFVQAAGEQQAAVSLDELVEQLSTGARFTVSADYGSGKSEALRQAFARLRSRFFKRPDVERIPVHLNLRDFYGLRTPREVLRRHAEEIGFRNEDSLIAAWRSGNCTLLLDGFDELVPARWVGGARDLQQVRWSALEPVRQLVEQTPSASGIVAAGRAQYFSDEAELLSSLGLRGGGHYQLLDFTEDQASELLGRETVDLPDWLPPRPLLLRFLVDNELLPLAGQDQVNERNGAWHAILDLIAQREAQRVGSLTPGTIRTLIARVATITKASVDPGGAVTVADMRGVFREVCGYEAEEEGLQLLLRLPGLASTGSGADEGRRFIDLDLADASYGLDLAAFLMAPYGAHPLAGAVSWTSASGDLSAGVAAVELTDRGFGAGSLLGALSKRLDHALFDAVLLDTVRTIDYMGLDSETNLTPFFSEVLIRSVDLSGDVRLLGTATFSDCIVESVTVDGSLHDQFPKFQNCIIGSIDGWSEIPSALSGNFPGSEIGRFIPRANTTDALVDLDLAIDDRVALVILKKVYLQPGSGRKIAALYRGMPLTDRGEVAGVTAQLVAAGLLGRVTGRGRDLVVPVKGYRRALLELLGEPQQFSLERALTLAAEE